MGFYMYLVLLATVSTDSALRHYRYCCEFNVELFFLHQRNEMNRALGHLCAHIG